MLEQKIINKFGPYVGNVKNGETYSFSFGPCKYMLEDWELMMMVNG